jgi:hypothetical protein
MKAEHFGGEDVRLHASALRDPTAEQLAALSKFFREQRLARFAVTMSKSVELPAGVTPFDLAAGSLMIAKSRGLPGLEVADFVMHAAGRRAPQMHRDP